MSAGARRHALAEHDGDGPGPPAAEVRRGTLAQARQVQAERREAKRTKKNEVVPDVLVKRAAICVPGAAKLMNVNVPTLKKTPLDCLVRLAVSARVRGSGTAVDRTRRLQQRAAALTGSAMLEQQKRGWEEWLSRPGDVDLVPAEKSFFEV